MTTYTFNPKLSTQNVSWNDPSIWVGGIVPNSPDADVVFPTVTTAGGSPYVSTINLATPPDVTVNSISLSNNNLKITGNLTVIGSAAFLTGSQVTLSGNLAVGSLTNANAIFADGQITALGTISNAGQIFGNGLTITSQLLDNDGSIRGDVTLNVQQLNSIGALDASAHALTVNVSGGGFGGTLTEGSLAAGSGTLSLNWGGLVLADAASIQLSGGGDIVSFDNASNSYVPIESTLQLITSSGSLALSGREYNWGPPLVVEGSLSIGGTGAFGVPTGATLNAPLLTVNGGRVNFNGTLNTPQLSIDATGTVSGDGLISGAIFNAGPITAAQISSGGALFFVSNKLTIDGSINGDGMVVIHAAIIGLHFSSIRETLELAGPVSSSQKIVFADGTGTLVLDDPAHFGGSIAPVAGDGILLPNTLFSTITNYSYSGDGNGGTLRLEQPSGHIDLAFSGNFDDHSFQITAVPGAISTIPSTVAISGFAAPLAGLPVDEWLLQDGQWKASFQPGAQSPDFLVAAVVDFTRDGTSDIVWHNPNTGEVQFWLMSKGHLASTSSPGIYPNHDFRIAGIGDFNNDGANDILWFNPNNSQTDIWELQANGSWKASVAPGPHPAGYQILGVSDLDGDGTSDIIWYNPATNHLDEWKIVDGKWAGSIDLGIHPGSGWKASGIGDFNHDGTKDIFWFNSGTGETDIWELANGKWLASVNPGPHPLGYQVAGIGDFNGDGYADVLFFNQTTGSVDEWKLVNGRWIGSVDLGLHPGSAHIAGVGDFLGNGTSDVLWY